MHPVRRARQDNPYLTPNRRRFLDEKNVGNEKDDPDERDLARTQCEQARKSSEEIVQASTNPIERSSSVQKEKPSRGSEKKGKAVGATGNVINRGAVNRMHRPG